MYFIYILYSKNSDRYYVGHTSNVTERIFQHNNQPKITYTSKFRPWELIISFQVDGTRGDAMRLERYIKKLKNRKVIERLISDPDYFNELAQLVGVPTSRD